MPRYNFTLTMKGWIDAGDANAAEYVVDGLIHAAKDDRLVNINEDATELEITEEPRPTNAELMCDV